MCACVEALVLGGARVDLGSGAKPVLEHASLSHVARSSAAKAKADKGAPRLEPVASSKLSAMVHAQLGAAWVEDSRTVACMACGAAFTNMIRRHHCRMLGIVVCDSCSTRRAVLPGQGSGGARVCDAAFNVVLHLGRLAQRYDVQEETARKARAAREALEEQDEAARVEQQRMELLQAGAAARAAKRSSTAAAASSSSSAAASTASRHRDVGAAQGMMHEACSALRERGEKLGVLGARVEDLGKEAEDFHDMARQLRKQAERNARWF